VDDGCPQIWVIGNKHLPLRSVAFQVAYGEEIGRLGTALNASEVGKIGWPGELGAVAQEIGFEHPA
jgi:hypothetical protein